MRTRLFSALLFVLVPQVQGCHQGRVDPNEGAAPSPASPENEPVADACAAVRCMAGTHCVAHESGAECVPDAPDTNASATGPCASTLCAPDTYCDDVSGEAQCLPLPSCAATSCPTGNHCELVPVQCVRAPCPPQPTCVPNEA